MPYFDEADSENREKKRKKKLRLGSSKIYDANEFKTFYHRKICDEMKNLRKKWLTNIIRAVDLPKDSWLFICSKHFKPECFQRDLRVVIFFLVSFLATCYRFNQHIFIRIIFHANNSLFISFSRSTISF